MNSPIGTPSHYKESKKTPMGNRTPTMKPYEAKPTTRVSMFEMQKPNKVTRAVDPFEKTVGERPEVPHSILFDYRDKTPQIDSIIEYCTDLIVGTDLNINTDEETDKDGKIKKILDEFSEEISLYEKVKNQTDVTLTSGTSIYARIISAGKLQNLEEVDMTSVKRVKRDIYGNVVDYLVDDGNGGEQSIKKVTGVSNINQVFIPFKFRNRGRDFFGRSIFHGLAVERNVGNRTTRPIVEALWSLDDVVIGTLENFAYPVEYHIFDGINETDLELEAEKIKESKPGDRFFLSRMHEIDRREPTQARFDSFFEHTSNIVQLGTGFPLEILLGDFTSRASSQTTDSLLMRRIKAFQQSLVKFIRTEVLEFYLKSLGMDEKKIKEYNISIEFATQTPMEYTPDQVLARCNSGVWTKDEVRNYDKLNGQDLFDDDIIAKEDKEKKELEKQQIGNDIQDKKIKKDTDESVKLALKVTNAALLKETVEAQNDRK